MKMSWSQKVIRFKRKVCLQCDGVVGKKIKVDCGNGFKMTGKVTECLPNFIETCRGIRAAYKVTLENGFSYNLKSVTPID